MIPSIGFVGVRTEAFDATVTLYRDGPGLKRMVERTGVAWFRYADGSQNHVYDEADADHDFFTNGPVVGFVVEDVVRARAALAAGGIECIGEPQRDGGTAWNHDRDTDGNVHEIIGPDPVAA